MRTISCPVLLQELNLHRKVKSLLILLTVLSTLSIHVVKVVECSISNSILTADENFSFTGRLPYHRQDESERRVSSLSSSGLRQKQKLDFDYEDRMIQADSNLERELQNNVQPSAYFTVDSDTVLGRSNLMAAVANPLKGHVSNHVIHNPSKNQVDFSLEAFYFPFNAVVVEKQQYNWTSFENALNFVANRRAHSIPRFFIHYPGTYTLAMPQYLFERDRVEIVPFFDKGMAMVSPIYNDTHLMDAMRDFIFEFGRKYDGDKRLYTIQAGLAGYWGEWHCSGNDFLSQAVLDSIALWYSQAFQKTPVQIRYPQRSVTDTPLRTHFGYHDDSFTHSTLDGPYNGGLNRSKYFWPLIVNSGLQEFWKWSVMGGEVRPENTAIVHNHYAYRTNSEFQADYNSCIRITHASYMKNAYLFRGIIPTFVRDNAQRASAEMGYNFRVRQVAVQDSSLTSPGRTNLPQGQFVDVYVTIEQIGIAPFYFDLAVQLECPSTDVPGGILRRFAWGVHSLVNQYSTGIFTLTDIPATSLCLRSISLQLASSYVSSVNRTGVISRPIVFAQGTDGIVRVTVPVPPGGSGLSNGVPIANGPVPVPIVSRSPTTAPVASISMPLLMLPIATPASVALVAQSPVVRRMRFIGSFALYNTEQGRIMSAPVRNNNRVKLSEVGRNLTLFCNITMGNRNPNPNKFDRMNSTIINRVRFSWKNDFGVQMWFTTQSFGSPWYAISPHRSTNTPNLYHPSNYVSSRGFKNITATVYNRAGTELETRGVFFTVV